MALQALNALGIIHTDLNGDNVMFVNRQDQPLKVKANGFGWAVSDVALGEDSSTSSTNTLKLSPEHPDRVPPPVSYLSESFRWEGERTAGGVRGGGRRGESGEI